MTAQQIELVMRRYRLRQKIFDAVAARRSGGLGASSPIEERAAVPLIAADGSDLSKRELEVLTLIAEGLSNAEIAHYLVLSTETVKTHVQRIIGRLNVRNRAHAVAVGIKLGLITPCRPERHALGQERP